jgi:hypothetical protein
LHEQPSNKESDTFTDLFGILRIKVLRSLSGQRGKGAGRGGKKEKEGGRPLNILISSNN